MIKAGGSQLYTSPCMKGREFLAWWFFLPLSGCGSSSRSLDLDWIKSCGINISINPWFYIIDIADCFPLVAAPVWAALELLVSLLLRWRLGSWRKNVIYGNIMIWYYRPFITNNNFDELLIYWSFEASWGKNLKLIVKCFVQRKTKLHKSFIKMALMFFSSPS